MGILNNQWVVNIVGGLIVAVLGYFIIGWLGPDDKRTPNPPSPVPDEVLLPETTYLLETGTNYKIVEGYRLQYFWRDITHNGEPKTELYYTIQGTGLNTRGGFPKEGTLNYNACSITNRDTNRPEFQLTLRRFPETNSEAVEASYSLDECG